MNQRLLRGTDKDTRTLLIAAAAQGCTVERRRGGHIGVTCPDGTLIIVAFTSGSGRTTANLRTRLRRAGVTIT